MTIELRYTSGKEASLMKTEVVSNGAGDVAEVAGVWMPVRALGVPAALYPYVTVTQMFEQFLSEAP